MTSTPPFNRINANTACFSAPTFVPSVDVEQLHRARAQASVAYGQTSRHGRPGFRIFAAWGHETHAWDLPARGDEYAVIGRHTSCDMRLDHDPQLSLRHLLARTVELDDGALALRLFDLQASQPFVLEDGVARRSIVAAGPIVVRLGGYVLGAFPYRYDADPSDGDTWVCGTPYRSPGMVLDTSGIMPRCIDRRRRATHVTIMPPPPELAMLRMRAVGLSEGLLTLQRGRRSATIELSETDLDHGVIVGRSPRSDPSLLSVMHTGISRSHVLLLRERGSIYAYDLCSLQGIWSRGERVKRCLLSDRGAELDLGEYDPVRLVWQPRAIGPSRH
jgi:hypothetical protein